uniref:Uncharacterized protein n=1 Tax=Oryza barthii TaxID=65489 RepID=A0A0D3ERD1_9ORYZ
MVVQRLIRSSSDVGHDGKPRDFTTGISWPPSSPTCCLLYISCFESGNNTRCTQSLNDEVSDKAWGLDSLSIDGKLLRQPADRGHRVDQETTAHA